MRKTIFLVILILLSCNALAVIDEVNQHTTEITRQSIVQINQHTDDKMNELTARGEQIVVEANNTLKNTARNVSILIFISMTGSLIFALLLVELIKQYIWKKRQEILPLIDLPAREQEARLWIQEGIKKGFGKANLTRKLYESKYPKESVKRLISEVY